MAQNLDLTHYFTRNQVNSLARVTAPAAPLVAVRTVGGTYIDLTVTPPPTPNWAVQQPKYVVGYTVSFSASNGQTGSVYMPAAATLRLQPLVQGVQYQITVSVTDCLGLIGTASSPLIVTTALNTTPPAQPAITVTPLATGVRINVSPFNTEQDFAGYDLYHDTSASVESEPPALLPSASFRGISFIEKAFAANGNYYFFLRAKNYSGLYRDSLMVGPIAVIAPASTVPAPISMATATATANADGSITLHFPASGASGLTGYNIYRQVLVNSMSGWVQVSTVAAGTTSYTDTATIEGLTYQYSVSVVTAGGESTFDTTHVVKATSHDSTAPAAPLGNIRYAGKTGGILVAWDASPDPSTVGYIVRWRYAQAGLYSTFNEGEQVDGTSYLLDGLLDPATGLAPTRDSLANEFEVEIASLDINGNRSVFLARTDAGGARRPVEYPELNGYQPADSTPPVAPVMNAPVLNPDTTITVSWQATGAPTQAGFIVEKRANYTATGLSLWETLLMMNDAGAGTKQYTSTGLEPFKFRGTQYRFRVRSVDTSGNVSSANLVENPAFSGLTSWNGGTVTSGYSGYGGVKASGSVAVTQSVAVEAGSMYTLSAYYAKDSNLAAQAVLTLQWFQGASSLGTQTVQGAVSAVFQRADITALAPAGADSMLITLKSADSSTVVWSAVQLEESPIVTAFGDSKTAWLHAVDTTGPNTTGYVPNASLTPDFGCFHLNWTNGTDSTFYNCTFEIWRQITARTDGGSVDSAFVKIHEVSGTSDGLPNTWTDNSPTIDNKVTAKFALRARDRFGCAPVDGTGKPVFFYTSSAQTSLNMNDKQIQPGPIFKLAASGIFGSNNSHGMWKNGTLLHTGARSYNVSVWNRATMTEDSFTVYDLWADAANAATMANALNALDSTKIVFIWTWDEPWAHRLVNGLATAMFRCGASASFTGSQFRVHGAYLMVGIPGIGRGNGMEMYAGSVDNDTAAYCEMSVQVVNGNVIGMKGGLTSSIALEDMDGALNDTQITPGFITTPMLSTGNLKVGGAGSRPLALLITDENDATIGEVGQLTGTGRWGGQYGGWFKNLGVGGPDPSNAKLWIDNNGQLNGVNGGAIDSSGNVVLKNKVTAVCAGSASFLTTTPTEIPSLGYVSNSALSITLKGNPCLLGVILNFAAQSAGGGQCTGINWSSPNCTNTGLNPSPPTISITFSGGGGGSGTTAGVQWTPVFGNGTQNPPTGFSATTYFNGGSGYTSPPTAIINVSVPNGCTYDGHNGPTTYQVTPAPTCSISASSPVAGADIEVSVLMDGQPLSYTPPGGDPITLLGSMTLLTNSNGQASYPTHLMIPIAAGAHTFQVKASTTTPSNNIQTGTCVFILVELG